MKWTSRTRVVTALNHKEPDRVPVDFVSEYNFYTNLKQYLDLNINEDVQYSTFMEVIPHPKVLNELGVDIISLKLCSPNKPKFTWPEDHIYKNSWGVVFKRIDQKDGSHVFKVVHSPLEHATIKDLNQFKWPKPNVPELREKTEERAKYLFKNTDLAIMGRFGGSIVEMGGYLLGFKEWMLRTASDPEFVSVFLDNVTDIQMEYDRAGLEAAAKYVQIIKVSGEDLGMQSGPLYSPKMFHELFLPRLRRRWNAIRTHLDSVNPDVKIMLHSDGAIRTFIPDLIDSGIQILDPVQPLAVGMDSVGLKRDFGEKLSFHGGIDIQEVLPFGTPSDVKSEVQRKIQDFAPGGGYILSASHLVQSDIPVENIIAMLQSAQEFGKYPIRLE